MFCSHCGKEVAAGAKFCANCGAAVNSQPTPAAEPPKAPAPTAQREVPAVEQVGTPSGNMTGSGGQPEKKKKGVPKKPLIVIAAVLVLTVGFGAVLSLFGDGSEPDSDSKGLDGVESSSSPVSDSKGLDWVEKIPYVSGNYSVIGNLDDVGWYFGYSSDIEPIPYDEIQNRIDFHFDFDHLGAPDNDEIKYFGDSSLSLTGVHGDQVVYWATEDVVQGKRRTLDYRSDLPTCEPLIVKNDSGIYYLCYKRDNCFMIYVTVPDDPDTSYSKWTLMYDVYASAVEYCDLLNGKQELEIVSIPGEGGNSDFEGTATQTGASSLDWVDNIPLVPGGAILYYFEDEGVQAHTRPYVFEKGGIVDFIGYSNSEQMNYHTAEIDGGTVCTGFAPDGAVYAEVWDDYPGPVGDYYFSVVCEYEPVIGRRDDGYCYLFYMREYDSGGSADPCYEMYMVQPTDSPNYEDWNFKAYVHCNNLQYFDYLNGTKELEIISIPDGNNQHEAFPENGDTPSVSDAIAPDWVDKIPVVSGDPSIEGTGTSMIEDSAYAYRYAYLMEQGYRIPSEDMVRYDFGAPVSNETIGFYWPESIPNANELGDEWMSKNIITFGLRLTDGKLVYYYEGRGESSMPLYKMPDGYFLTEPLIGKTEQGIYLLCYKHNGTYVVIKTKPDDPSTSYNGWRTIGRVFVDGVEYYDYLNGTLPVEVVSIPGENTQ